MDLTSAVEGFVHEPTQTEGRGLDLTVAAVEKLTAPGQVDFGGGELAAVETVRLAPEKRDAGDDYGWWHLDAGQYLLAYNETLDAEEPIHLQPRTELLDRGATHPTLRVTELPHVPLSVGGAGIEMKENARVSTLLVSPGR